MPLLEPERYFSRISQIDIKADLFDQGFEHVLLDIDNTILSRATHDVPRDVMAWIARARDMGVSFCLVSNNWHESALHLAESINVPIVAKSLKPLPFAFLRALRKIDATRANTVCIGDQLMTDVLGARLAGMAAYMVAPLVDVDLKHTLMLRNLERALLKGRQPEPIPSTSPSVGEYAVHLSRASQENKSEKEQK